MAVRGRASGRFFLVAGAGCDHIDIFAPWNSGDDPEPLIAHWNQWAVAESAKISTARAHSAEQAAAFIAALGLDAYKQLGSSPWA